MVNEYNVFIALKPPFDPFKEFLVNLLIIVNMTPTFKSFRLSYIAALEFIALKDKYYFPFTFRS